MVYIAGVDLAENINISNCNCYKTGNQNLTNGSAITLYANCQNANIVNCNFDTCREGIQLSNYSTYETVPKHVNISNCNFN